MSYRGRSIPSGIPVSIDNISSLQGGSFLTPCITNAGNTSIYALTGGSSGNATFNSVTTSSIQGNSATFSTLTCGIGFISSFSSINGSFSTISANNGVYSSITAYSSITTPGNLSVLGNFNLNGNILTTDTGAGGELLLNGIPIATTSNISSLTEWSFYPAISTIDCSTHNLIDVGDIVGKSGDMNLSNVGAITFDIAGSRALVNLSTINGAPYVPGSSGPSNQISGITTLDIADAGASPSPAIATITAQNGTYGKVDITANAGFGGLSGGNISLTANGGSGTAGLFGQIDIVANQGVASGTTTGGKINITANSGFSGGLTSAVNINAGGITSQAGYTTPVGSVAGYNFIGGNSGVNICGGFPSIIPNVPGTTYLYGTTGVEIGSDTYLTKILPYQYGLVNAEDIMIAGRSLDIGLGNHTAYVNLSTCKTISFGGTGDPVLGQLIGVSTINGSPYNGSPGVPTQIAQAGSSVVCEANAVINMITSMGGVGLTPAINIQSDNDLNMKTLGGGSVIIRNELGGSGTYGASQIELHLTDTTPQTGNIILTAGSQSKIEMDYTSGNIVFNDAIGVDTTAGAEILYFNASSVGSNIGEIYGVSTINGAPYVGGGGVPTQIAQGGGSVACSAVGGVALTTSAFHSITFNNNLNVDATGGILTFPQVAGSNVGALIGISTINSVAYPPPVGVPTSIAQGGGSVACSAVGGVALTTSALHYITFNNNLNVDATGQVLTFPQVAGSNVGGIVGLSTINGVSVVPNPIWRVGGVDTIVTTTITTANVLIAVNTTASGIVATAGQRFLITGQAQYTAGIGINTVVSWTIARSTAYPPTASNSTNLASGGGLISANLVGTAGYRLSAILTPATYLSTAPFSVVDTPPAGTYWYSLWAYSSGASGVASENVVLTVLQV